MAVEKYHLHIECFPFSVTLTFVISLLLGWIFLQNGQIQRKGTTTITGWYIVFSACCPQVEVLHQSPFPYWYLFHLTTKTWDSLKPAWFLLDHQVTKPAYSLIKLCVLLSIIIALRLGYWQGYWILREVTVSETNHRFTFYTFIVRHNSAFVHLMAVWLQLWNFHWILPLCSPANFSSSVAFFSLQHLWEKRKRGKKYPRVKINSLSQLI